MINMAKNLDVGVSIETNLGSARIVAIGTVHYNQRTKAGWAMLTLRLDSGVLVHAPAREDELAISKSWLEAATLA